MANQQNDMVTCTINGVQARFPKGMRIIEAAEQLGLGIAHYCYHPGLSAPAMCRMCLVEVEGAPKLVPACVTEIGEGQVIHTESDHAREALALSLWLGRWGWAAHAQTGLAVADLVQGNAEGTREHLASAQSMIRSRAIEGSVFDHATRFWTAVAAYGLGDLDEARAIAEEADRHLRLWGLTSMIAGLALLYVVRG
jgi:hypothetical protein